MEMTLSSSKPNWGRSVWLESNKLTCWMLSRFCSFRVGARKMLTLPKFLAWFRLVLSSGFLCRILQLQTCNNMFSQSCHNFVFRAHQCCKHCKRRLQTAELLQSLCRQLWASDAGQWLHGCNHRVVYLSNKLNYGYNYGKMSFVR